MLDDDGRLTLCACQPTYHPHNHTNSHTSPPIPIYTHKTQGCPV